VLFAVMALRFGLSWALPAFLVFASVLVAVSVIDLEFRRIPTPIVWTGFALGLALLVVATASLRSRPWWMLARGLIGAAACGMALLAVALIVPKGMGLGDVRLVTLEGLFLGWLGAGIPLVGIFLGFLLGSIVGVALIFFRKAGRKTKLPFGPFLAAGAVIAVVYGQEILNRYRGT
jgi:leader peptidase (prepilin peptidase)/N-methyltransferase